MSGNKDRVSTMFSSLKDKLTGLGESLREIAVPMDPQEKELLDLVERATSELLISCDWGLNMEIVDAVNSDPLEVTDKVNRSLRRQMLKGDVKVQLLTLTVLETCIKNCVPHYARVFPQSELWKDLLKVGVDRYDPEVRDQILGLIEQWGRAIPEQAYRSAYEDLLDSGVSFPIRPDEGQVPVNMYLPQVPRDGPNELSEEDKRAIAQAVAEMEAEVQQDNRGPLEQHEESQSDSVSTPLLSSSSPHNRPHHQLPPPPPPPAAPTGGGPYYQPPTVQEAQSIPHEPPVVMAATQQFLEVVRNTTDLLSETLNMIPDEEAARVQEQYVADLAGECFRYQSMVMDFVSRTESEEDLQKALILNDDLQRTMARYQELSNLADQGGTPNPQQGPGQQEDHFVYLPQPRRTSSGVQSAGPNFTLIDEEEAEDLAALETRRNQRNPLRPVSPTGAVGAPITSGPDMILFDEEPAGQGGGPPSGVGESGPPGVKTEDGVPLPVSTSPHPIEQFQETVPPPAASVGDLPQVPPSRGASDNLVAELDKLVLRNTSQEE